MALLLSACSGGGAPEAPADHPDNAADAAPAPPASNGQAAPAAHWDLQASGAGTALALLSSAGDPVVRLSCPAGAGRLTVEVPSFRMIGSEDRLSFGGGGEVVALVAFIPRYAGRRGVTATGPVPDNLAALLRAPVSVSYGAQTSGPHPAPAPTLTGAFVAGCAQRSPPPAPAPLPGPSAGGPAAPAGPCLMQGSERLQVAALRAVGTEPFWAARIEGRCVTYSNPEDQQGTRVWTRYTPAANGGGTWAGALSGRRFELRIRPQAGCSDGMSDRLYPFAAELLVNGEQRRGCAEPG
ncbi:MAG TPA: hypothetical protein VGX37_05550 [Allosphingosinicella sp.]|nr:hypothetical protein [Allosphingosinicella sp.]